MNEYRVETSAGVLSGAQGRGALRFYGVPFAGSLARGGRFSAPAEVLPWAGVRSALRPGQPAPQKIPGFPLSSKWFGLATDSPGEDCLSLNLTTPACDGGKRPVLVFLHGGGFVFGSGASPLYDGGSLARNGDVVVVTLNYRLGALGFAQLGPRFSELPSNRGLRDQLSALAWVAREIAAFGGDPDNVTLFGESAGAMSIGALLGCPEARPYFRRVILQSGALHHVSSRERAEAIAAAWLEALGDPSLPALSQIPLPELLKAQNELGGLGFEAGRLPWQPAIDGEWLPDDPLAALAAGACSDKEILIGTNADEWKLFALGDRSGHKLEHDDWLRRLRRVIDPETAGEAFVRKADALYASGQSPREAWCAFQRDRVFVAPALALADAQARGGGKAFVYRFDWHPPLAGRRLGAFHGLELPFVFGNLDRGPMAFSLGLSPAARRLSRRMGRSWTNFARDGHPGEDWPHHAAGDPGVFIFGRTTGWSGRADGPALRYQAELASRTALGERARGTATHRAG